MLQQVDDAPVSNFPEEVVFNLAGTGSRNGPTIDTRDWYGGSQSDFGTRHFGFPFLDAAILAPGNANLILQYATNTTPGVEPPALTFSDFLIVGAVAGAWGVIDGKRLHARWVRVRVVDTSGVANNGIYLVYHVRSR